MNEQPNPADIDEARGRRPWRSWAIVIVVILAAATLVWWLTQPKTKSGGAGGEYAGAAGGGAGGRAGGGRRPPATVGLATITRGDMPVVTSAIGTVTPLATVSVLPQVAGQIVAIHFNEGQRVNRGALLA